MKKYIILALTLFSIISCGKDRLVTEKDVLTLYSLHLSICQNIIDAEKIGIDDISISKEASSKIAKECANKVKKSIEKFEALLLLGVSPRDSYAHSRSYILEFETLLELPVITL